MRYIKNRNYGLLLII